MKQNLILLFLILLPTLANAGTAPPPTIPAARPDPKAVLDYSRAVIRINCTAQFFDFQRPWTKKNPLTRRGLGAIIGPNEVLVSASLVAGATYIEFERPTSAERTPALIKHIDYEANLALLEAADPAFLQNTQNLVLDETARLGSIVEILQLETNGEVAPTTGRITTITMAPGVIDDSLSLLIFRVTAPVQQRDYSFVLPVVKDGRLLGMGVLYDSRNQTTDIIPPPIIRRFLQDAMEKTLHSFPRAGIRFTPLRNPQLRKYLQHTANEGVLITGVDPRSPAAVAGIQKNDILMAINGVAIDPDGSFQHPEYGRIHLSYLITTAHRAGETVRFSLLRSGKPLEVPVVVLRFLPEHQSVPRYWIDRQPIYLIAGGFIFQELTRSYLKEWGNDWSNQAPQRLVAADFFQKSLRPNGEKVVFLSGVIPTPGTIGYENLGGTIVESVDDQPIHSIAQLKEALTTTVPKIFKIRITDDPRLIFLNSVTIEQAKLILARNYGITQLSNIPTAVPPPSQPSKSSPSPIPPATPPNVEPHQSPQGPEKPSDSIDSPSPAEAT